MHSSFIFALLPAAAFAATHQVMVGANKQFVFSPTTVQAAAGDQVQFVFVNANHTVTSGNANQGCTPDGKFYSGFVPVAAANPKGNRAALPSFTVNVANTQPQAVYCSQAQHCQVGMVMVINPAATGPTTLAAYQAKSAQAKTNVIPSGGPRGGQLANLQKLTAAQVSKPAANAGKTGAGAAAAAGGKAAGAGKAAAGKAAGAAKTAAGKAAAALKKAGVQRQVEDDASDAADITADETTDDVEYDDSTTADEDADME